MWKDPYWGARLRTVASNGCRDVRRRVKRRSITERTPIAACRATVPLRHSRRGLRCERGGTVPDPSFSPVAEHPGPRKGLGKRLYAVDQYPCVDGYVPFRL